MVGAPQVRCITRSRPNYPPLDTKATSRHAPLLRSLTILAIATKKPILRMARRGFARRITYFEKLWMQQVQGAVGACQGDDQEHQTLSRYIHMQNRHDHGQLGSLPQMP